MRFLVALLAMSVDCGRSVADWGAVRLRGHGEISWRMGCREQDPAR